MIKCAIFDLDGTLLDTLDNILFHLNNTLMSNGVEPITRDECRRFLGKGAKNLIKRAMDSRGAFDEELYDKIISEYIPAYDRAPYHLTRAYDGIVELIAELRLRGIKLGVLSNKPDFATRATVSYFFADAFDVVHGGRDGIPLKPAPDAAIDMLSELGVTAEETAYIGDSDVDVLTAKAFSPALSITVLWGFRDKPELIAVGTDTFAENADDILKLITES